MKIIVNGQHKDIDSSVNLRILIEKFCKNPARVIAELNGTVVKNQEWEKRNLKEGDTLELVNFVGGG